MIPIELTIEGIFSYQTKQTINFKNLLADQIFGIFGTVGSGKSSILDAITFALYGQLEKMNQRDSINYNLMNLKSDSLLIDFSFTDDKNEEYRFVVKGRRSANNFEEVKTLTKLQYKKINGNWESSDYNAEDIIGLSYDNFKRTIIIPQGKFMEFLQLKDADRTKMLKDIFDLEKYDLAMKVSPLIKENDLNIATLQGNLEGLNNISKEKVGEKELELNNKQNDKKKLDSEIKEKTEEQSELEITKKLVEEKAAKNSEFEKLKTEKSGIELLKKQLADFEYCQTHFKPLFDNKESYRIKVKDAESRVELLQKKIDKTNNQLKENTEKFKECKVEYNKIDLWRTEAADLKRVLDIKQLEQKAISKTNEINSRKKSIDELASKKSLLLNAIKSLRKEIKELEKETSTLQKLYEINQWFNTRNVHSENLESALKNINSKKELIKQLLDEKNTIIHTGDQQLIKYDKRLTIEETIELLESTKSQNEQKHEELQKELHEFKIKQHLKEYSLNLSDGKACPVCGSLKHPHPINIDSIDGDIKSCNDRISENRAFDKKMQNYIKGFSDLKNRITLEENALKDLQDSHNNKSEQLDAYIKTFNWAEYSVNDHTKIKKAIETIESSNKTLTIKRDTLDKKQTEQERVDQKHSGEKDQVAKLKADLSGIESQKDTLTIQLEQLSFEDYQTGSTSQIKEAINTINVRIEKVEKEYNALDEDITELNNLNIADNATLKTIREQLKQDKDELKLIEQNILEKVQSSKFENQDFIIEVLNREIDIEKEKDRISRFEKKYNNLESEIKAISEKLKGKSFDVDIYNKLAKDVAALKSSLSTITEEIGALNDQIKKLIKDLEEKQKIENQLKLKNQRAEDLNVMKQLFNGAGFVKYVSSVYMKQLIEYANKRFHKLTKQSLSLVLNGKNGFDVIDYLNNGRSRNVKTLSGGQMFQASLSLALALAGSVQKQNRSDKNFFFLDEGFGTQDEESLRLVFDTIKSLRKENRVVGIISHVDDLQNEISTYLTIKKDDENGSLIHTSW
jgi:exonuclease SbcC